MSFGDELAVTETASPSAKLREEQPIKQIGRYRLLRELGAGGMGVVHAAFDPELERNVALKVVLPGVSTDAKQRLLREARAMARLAHPNVVTVYEVGSVDGRDYIAMELIDGTNLVDWLATKPSAPAVLDAFIAAGNGLATAHEAAIVHRDFKPHNVLRSRRGRVMVTDFGLARESAVEAPVASRDTQPLSGLTQTGAVLGTPAYMAPEQWQGGEVTPATDQFAFCVALVEALAGARPFRGDSVEELRDAVLKGPDRVDLSRVPRRLRAPLRRGMAIDPAHRWPSMHALIAHLHRRSPVLWLALAAIAAAAAVITALAMRHPTQIIAAATPGCDAPSLAPEKVWNADLDHTIRAAAPNAADLFASTFARWTDVRANVCTQGGASRGIRLACLDKVLLRIDALRRARMLVPKASDWGLHTQMYRPEVCMLDEPPRMPASYSDAAIVGMALRQDDSDLTLFERLRAAAPSDSCGQMYFALLAKFGDNQLDRARGLAQLCGDDQAYSSVSMHWLDGRIGQFTDLGKTFELDELQHIVDRVANPFITSQYWMIRGDIAWRQGDFDGAIGFYRRAQSDEMELEAHRKLTIATVAVWRGAPGDYASAEREVASLRAMWTAEMGDIHGLDPVALSATWLRGDVKSAHAGLAEIYLHRYPPASDGPAVRGTVVDARGAPVAGATVAAGVQLVGDAGGPVISLFEPLMLQERFEPMQVAVTDANGAYAFAHVYPHSEVIAQRGDERSLARADGVLALAPTRTVRGKLAARGNGIVVVEAIVPGQRATVVAPVDEDGSYELAGVSAGALARVARISRQISVHGPLSPLDAVAPPNRRELEVTVRGKNVDGGFVWVLGGRVRADTVGQIVAKERELAYVRTLVRMHKEDLVVTVGEAPGGPLTVCAHGFHVEPDLADGPDIAKVWDSVTVRCVALGPDAHSVTIDVPAAD